MISPKPTRQTPLLKTKPPKTPKLARIATQSETHSMKQKSPDKDTTTIKDADIESVSSEEMYARARELALLEGRAPSEVTQADYEQAKEESATETDPNRQPGIIYLPAEATLGDPVPGSVGHQAAESPPEEEDEEGHSLSEQLVDKGMERAEREQVLQAARALEKTTTTQ